MIIKLDPNSLNLQVLVGTLEKYKPTKEIKALQKRVSRLKAKVDKFREEELIPELKGMQEVINKLNESFIEPKKE